MKLGKLAQTPEKILSRLDGEEGTFGLAALFLWPLFLTPVDAHAENIPDSIVAFTK